MKRFLMQNYPVTPAILLQWYQNYNKLYFNNELPEATLQNFCLHNYKAFGKFHYPKSIRGKSHPWMISETVYYNIDEYNRRHTLLHEMCHLWCFVRGFTKEGHGRRWRAIAAVVSKKSGFDIRRIHPGSFELSEMGQDKKSSLNARKEKAHPIIVLNFPQRDGVFIVKTSPSVLGKSIKWRDNKYRLDIHLKPEGFFLSDAFPKWVIRKSFRWGLVFPVDKYEKEILPRLQEGRQFNEAIDLFRAAKRNL